MEKIIFTTNSNTELVTSLTAKDGWRLGESDIKKFADKELFIDIKEEVKGKSVYVLGSNLPPADNALKLLLLLHALKANGANKISLIIPYFAYAKGDHIGSPGTSLSAQLMVGVIEVAGADEIITIDLHGKRVEKFFSRPLRQLSAIPLLADYFSKKGIDDLAVVSPDAGGEMRARQFAKALGINKITIIEKDHPAFGEVEVVDVSGEVKGKNVLIVDDMIQSGGTIIKAVQALKKQGAKDFYVVVTHFIFSGPSVPLLVKEKLIKQVVVTDTIPTNIALPDKFKKLSVVDLINDTIKD